MSSASPTSSRKHTTSAVACAPTGGRRGARRRPQTRLGLLVAMILTAFVVSLAAPTHADEMLRGLPSVVVFVSVDDPRTPQLRVVTGETLKTDVELRLRQSGVRVEPNSRQALRLVVLLLKPDSRDSYVYHLTMHLMEMVHVPRNASNSILATWSSITRIGVTPTSDLAEEIRKGARDLTDNFLNEYLAANPKP